ncbi:polysaccharide biosynthesis C-terminal domain-containing protein [Renibacterium salmoninarum]|nr:NAD-dependent epimerase/dehydratase family protein [Renibacterium salmoninarum]
MNTIALTGSNGFLGWHTRALAHSVGSTSRRIEIGAEFEISAAAIAMDDVESVIHIAGVNRGSDHEILEGNVKFAQQLVSALKITTSKPKRLVFANSIQAGNGSVYGEAKAEAGRILRVAAEELGIDFVDVLLPNLFGEHGRPFYNSVVATFCQMLVDGRHPEVTEDRVLDLLHAQDAAEVLIGQVPVSAMSELVAQRSVSELASALAEIAATYSRGTVPAIADRFDRNLFNTYRSFLVGDKLPIQLDRKEDSRGAFFEVVRSEHGQGQSSFSTTVPGITRGQHYHRRKIERFTVLAGSAEIAMRKLFSDEVVTYRVNGDQPVAIDMPTMWSHKITNVGSDMLYTMFWISEIYDPSSPDTFPEEV